jgi:uncharacterized repeat protein (TIGR03803 family)
MRSGWKSSHWAKRSSADQSEASSRLVEAVESRVLLSAYTFHSVASTSPNGLSPQSQLVFDSSGNAFGTTEFGGADGIGTVFEIAHGSTNLTTLASFNAVNGSEPSAGVTRDSSGDLFGTTYLGGSNGTGTVFEILHGSTKLTTVASFTQANGSLPLAPVTLDSSGDVFGTTSAGGAANLGTVFEIAHGSTKVTTIASFNGPTGSQPEGAITLDSGGDLFGTAYEGSVFGDGSVFEIAHKSTKLTTLVSFNGTDGALPAAGVTLDASGNLFGTTSNGGVDDEGTIFEVPHGTSKLTTLASFTGANGEAPSGGVTLDSRGDLFGTAAFGGADNDGTVFELPHGSTNLTTLASFNGTNGAAPDAGLTFDSSGNLWGTTTNGGTNNGGTVFYLSPPAPTSVTLGATADAYVRNGSYANTNFGSATQLLIKQAVSPDDRVAYLTFNLKGVAASSLKQATLRLFGALQTGSNPNLKINVLAVAQTGWSESTITFKNAPATGAVLGSAVVPNSTSQWYTFNLTSYLQKQLAAGKTSVSLAIVGTVDSTQIVAFNSRHASSNAPQLVVTE